MLGQNWMRDKVSVMSASTQKIEKACYAIKVRGSEYPKEMLKQMLSNENVDFEE